MENVNRSFINPNYRTNVYGGTLLLALTTASLFTRFETAKVIGMSTLACHIISLSNVLGQIKHLDYDLQLTRDDVDKCPLRIKNIYLNTGVCSLIDAKRFLVWGLVGSTLALTSRLPIAKLKRKVSMKQLAPFWISALALTRIAAETRARQIPIQRGQIAPPLLGVIAPIDIVNRPQITQARAKTFALLLFVLFLTMHVGTVAYRANLIFKKPL